jgi:hypothetical protein
MSADGPSTVTLTVSRGYPEVIAIEDGDTTGTNYGLAVDLGTTTVVGMLVNLAGMNFCAQASVLNRQITYGEELVSRLAFARDAAGREQLQAAAIESINAVIDQLASSNGIDRLAINEVCLSGNTVMQYLFTGRDPRGLEIADAVVDRKPFVHRAGDLGLAVNPEACVYCVPNVSRYVGGDAVGDVVIAGMHKSDGISLLIDHLRERRVVIIGLVRIRPGVRGRRHQQRHAGDAGRHRARYNRPRHRGSVVDDHRRCAPPGDMRVRHHRRRGGHGGGGHRRLLRKDRGRKARRAGRCRRPGVRARA